MASRIFFFLPIPFSAFLPEPSFVFADVIREGENGADGEDDKIYFFFTEVSVEYEFFGKLFIPRVARVCKVSTRCAPSAHTSAINPSIFSHYFLCPACLCMYVCASLFFSFFSSSFQFPLPLFFFLNLTLAHNWSMHMQRPMARGQYKTLFQCKHLTCNIHHNSVL